MFRLVDGCRICRYMCHFVSRCGFGMVFASLHVATVMSIFRNNKHNNYKYKSYEH